MITVAIALAIVVGFGCLMVTIDWLAALFFYIGCVAAGSIGYMLYPLIQRLA